jgi:hypothetical protein
VQCMYVENGSWSPVVPGYDALVATWGPVFVYCRPIVLFSSVASFWASSAGFGVCVDVWDHFPGLGV